MRLFEFDIDPTVAKIVMMADQLKTDLDKGKVDPNWKMDDLLKYFQNYGVTVDKTDLYNMIQKPPMKELISNIQGDKVVFKGHEPAPAANVGSTTPKDQKKIVSQMAHKAMK